MINDLVLNQNTEEVEQAPDNNLIDLLAIKVTVRSHIRFPSNLLKKIMKISNSNYKRAEETGRLK